MSTLSQDTKKRERVKDRKKRINKSFTAGGTSSVAISEAHLARIRTANLLLTQDAIVAEFWDLLQELRNEPLGDGTEKLSPEGKARILDYIGKTVQRRDNLRLELMFTREQIEDWLTLIISVVNKAFSRCWACQADLGEQRQYFADLAALIHPPGR